MYIDTLTYRIDTWEVPYSGSGGFWKCLKEYSNKARAMNRLGKLHAKNVPCRIVRVRRMDDVEKEEVLWESK